MLGKIRILLVLAMFCPTFVFGADNNAVNEAEEAENAEITELKNDEQTEEIKDIYERLSELGWGNSDNQERKELYDKIESLMKDLGQTTDDLRQNYEDLKANEQSLANRTLTAVTTAATGIGGMELAMGLSQQKADKEADANMDAYIATMRCTYGDGKQVKAGPEEIELPGGNSTELMNLRSEYFALAADLKARKEALGMKPGIESEEILDRGQMGLYDEEFVGITSGSYESLYRAKVLGSEADQAKIDEQKDAAKKRVIGGAVAAGAGVVVGVAGNSLINGKLGELIKEAKEKRNCKAMEKFVKEEENALKSFKDCLKKAKVKDTDKLTLDSVDPLYPSLFSFNSIRCDTDFAKAKDRTAVDLFDSLKADTNEGIISNMVTNFGPATTGKLLGVTISDNTTSTEITTAANKLGERAETVKKRIEEAKEQDKKSGCNYAW